MAGTSFIQKSHAYLKLLYLTILLAAFKCYGFRSSNFSSCSSGLEMDGPHNASAPVLAGKLYNM